MTSVLCPLASVPSGCEQPWSLEFARAQLSANRDTGPGQALPSLLVCRASCEAWDPSWQTNTVHTLGGTHVPSS